MIRIVIAGNPNSGKSTFFNLLSGCNQRVGNWAGVTVEKKEARLRRRYHNLEEEVTLVDLPGAYSMDAYTNDELEATSFLKKENIDVIVNIVDGLNLERSLYFSTQLIASKLPVIIALNKSDMMEKEGIEVDVNQLGDLIGAKVYLTSALTGKGVQDVIISALQSVREGVIYGKKSAKPCPRR